MANGDAVVIGVRGTVLALDQSTGTELWRTTLKGADFVILTLLDGKVLATTKGEIFALDAATGQILWHNKLTGLGVGLVSIAGDAQTPAMVADLRKRQAAASAGAAAASAGASGG